MTLGRGKRNFPATVPICINLQVTKENSICSPILYVFFIYYLLEDTERAEKQFHITQQNQWSKLMEWVSDKRAQELIETRSLLRRNQGTNIKPVDSFWFCFKNSGDPALVLFLFLLTPKGRYQCFCRGNFLVPPPGSWNHAGILTAVCKEVSLLLAAVPQPMSRTQLTENQARLMWPPHANLIFTFSLLTPSWIYNHLNFLDGQTDNRIHMKGFM